MSPFKALSAVTAFAFLSACATAPQVTEPEATTPPGQDAPPVPRKAGPASDWPAERGRIMKGLSGSGDIALQVRDDGALQLLLPGADAFSRGAEEPKASLRDALDRIAAVLAPMTATDVQIFGHTDSMASELHNLQLSIRRAEKVAEYLRSRGVALSRLRADGKGESEPIADNRTEEGRAKNRRVEIIVRPLVR
jgi:outer membrane protein OmpA-like peptidoglycan-associated protein